MEEIQSMLQDDRPILWVAWPYGSALMKVGMGGVTKIVAYGEPGHMANIPWLAIYKGDVLWQRVDAAGKEIGYA